MYIVRMFLFRYLKFMIGTAFLLVFSINISTAADPIIIDHTCTDIWAIPHAAINQAKADLHIAYGHTSHGSQIIAGMGGSGGAGLDTFMTNNGAPAGLFTWNEGGTGGALDLDDYFMSGDLGNPDRYEWEQRTRTYLNTPANADVNVVMWSWCGQADTTIANIDIYLNLMEGLIADYPNVHFVFMTGHLNGTGPAGQLNLANEHIRNHCIANGRILYDFADIESYDPDGLVNYMALMANDYCAYDSDGNGSLDRNWAQEWQDSHVEGVDWWASGAAHSLDLNGNLKGYAAWWLWATLAGMNMCIEAPSNLVATEDPENGRIVLTWTDNSGDVNESSFIIQRQVDGGSWVNDYWTVAADITTFADIELSNGVYNYRVVAHLDDDGTGTPCNSAASNQDGGTLCSNGPSDPDNLSSEINGADIVLTWNDNSDNETNFVVERRIDEGTYSLLATLPADTVTYNDESLAHSHSYTYRVMGVNDCGSSRYSNETSQYIEQAVSETIILKQNVDGYVGCIDAYLDAANPTTNYGATQYKTVLNSPKCNYALAFEMPPELSGKIILDAKLTLYCWSVSGWVADQCFNLFRLTESWEESSTTWEQSSSGNPWATPGGTVAELIDCVPIQNTNFYPQFDITPVVQGWVDGTVVNQGVLLRNDSPVSTGIKGSEYSEYGRPALEITYSQPPECTTDFDGDSDVDGSDLAVFVSVFDGSCMEEMANDFGKTAFR